MTTGVMWRRWVLAAVGVAGLACGDGEEPTKDRRPVVALTRDHLLLDRIGVSVPAPVAAGSDPSPQTLVSSDERVLRIDDRGQLVAVSNGSALVSPSAGGASMRVTVAAVSRLVLAPAEVTLAPGETVRLELRDEDERSVRVDGARWATSDIQIAEISGAEVTGRRPGEAVVTARYGGRDASARVVVRPDSR